MTYSEKLKHPRWQKKRLEILDRDGFKCSICLDDKKTLHIHHERYVGDPWDCPNDKLKSLCEDCHSFIHSNWDDYYMVYSKRFLTILHHEECLFIVYKGELIDKVLTLKDLSIDLRFIAMGKKPLNLNHTKELVDNVNLYIHEWTSKNIITHRNG